MHRRSKDSFAGLYNHFAHRAFQQWCEQGMPGNPTEFCYGAIASVLRNYIFAAEFQKVDGAKGTYWFIQWSYRNPQSDFEKDALEAAEMIRSGAESGATLGWVTNETYERWALNAEIRPALPAVSEAEARASLQPQNQVVVPSRKR
ncbi:hypothetical protein [Nostoc sp. FACHB-110]|uniref:hypothetical protein n=1 Tax=Nostoc sp. FACHB-110 TaxID=2692834 RepID=UPI001F553F1D|nr:hypothetical protein [Nostoc sp. FACHB-110]